MLLSPGLAAVSYGLSQVGAHGGFATAAVSLPLAAGTLLLIAFAFHALHTTTEPIIDLRLFRERSFAAAASLLFLSGPALYGAMLLLPLYYQQVRGASALTAGLMLAPQGVGALLSRSWIGDLTDRVGARRLVLPGIALTGLATAPFALAGDQTSQLVLAAALVVRGASLGAVTFPVMAVAYQGLRQDQIPHASSATRIMQQVGGAFGAAILAVILQQQVAGQTAAGGELAVAFDHAFWWTVGFTLLALFPALLLPQYASDHAAIVPDTAPKAVYKPSARLDREIASRHASQQASTSHSA
jgi:predicted MFS family arabinose efflux permease